jgi:hypothetical protein
MDNVALEPIQKLDTLAEKYNQSLQQIEAYAKFPNAYRLDVARQSLTLVNEVLTARDETNFLDYIQSRLDERLNQGFLVETFLQALSALEELLVAETRSLDEAVFLWRMFAHTRDMISRHTVKMLRSSQEVFSHHRRLAVPPSHRGSLKPSPGQTCPRLCPDPGAGY